MSSTEQDQPSLSDVLSNLDSDAAHPEDHGGASLRKWAVRLVLAIVILGLGVAGFASLRGGIGTTPAQSWQTQTVRRADLPVTITDDGNLESAENIDIKCEVAGGSTILWIIEDGKRVNEGDELVRLDSSQLEDQINQQKITYEKAKATYIQADKDLATAKIAVQEFLEGTYRQQLQDLEAKITIAMENLRSAENTLQHTQRMFRKGYVSPLQLETQQFAVERSKLDLDSAKTAKDVLERFTKAKTVTDLESKRDTAEAKKNAEKAAFDLEEGRLKRLEGFLKKCVIHAAKSGMVVYANEQSRGRFGPQQATEIKEGATVREQQTILRLPDLSKMQVKATVHESKVDQVRPGMRARIRIQDRDYQGAVVAVANQPEPTSFFSAAVKEYATTIRVEGDTTQMRPGMTAEVEILAAHLSNALIAPVAAVFESGGQTICVVKKGQDLEKRPVVLGLGNDQFVEVKQGVQEGEELVLNARGLFADQKRNDQQPAVDVKKRFGTGTPNDAKGGQETDRPEGSRTGTKAMDQAAPAPGLPGGPGGAGPQGPPGPAVPGATGGAAGAGRPKMPDLMSFDKDGDGKVSRDEAPERMRDFFERIDANGDGFLDRSEISALRSRRPRNEGPPKGNDP